MREKIYTSADLAVLLNRKPNTIRVLAMRYDIGFKPTPNARLFTETDLDAMRTITERWDHRDTRMIVCDPRDKEGS